MPTLGTRRSSIAEEAMKIVSLFTILFALVVSSAVQAQSPYCGGTLGEGCWPPKVRACYGDLAWRIGSARAADYCWKQFGHAQKRAYPTPYAPRGTFVPEWRYLGQGHVLVPDERCFHYTWGDVCVPLN